MVWEEGSRKAPSYPIWPSLLYTSLTASRPDNLGLSVALSRIERTLLERVELTYDGLRNQRCVPVCGL